MLQNVGMLTFCIFDTVMGDPSAKVDWLSAWNTLSGAQGAEVRVHNNYRNRIHRKKNEKQISSLFIWLAFFFKPYIFSSVARS
jgi:hypothetical protein